MAARVLHTVQWTSSQVDLPGDDLGQPDAGRRCLSEAADGRAPDVGLNHGDAQTGLGVDEREASRDGRLPLTRRAAADEEGLDGPIERRELDVGSQASARLAKQWGDRRVARLVRRRVADLREASRARGG